jgi:hypothetical protein
MKAPPSTDRINCDSKGRRAFFTPMACTRSAISCGAKAFEPNTSGSAGAGFSRLPMAVPVPGLQPESSRAGTMFTNRIFTMVIPGKIMA